MWLLLIILMAIFVAYLLFMLPQTQLLWHIPYTIKTSEKIVALTFDDGPNEPYTSDLLNFLSEKKIKATFFVVGTCALRHPETVKKIAIAGHTVGNHSHSHKFSCYFLHPSFKQEIVNTQRILSDLTGKTPELYRSPWLFRQPWLLRSVRRAGLRPVSGEFCHPLEVLQIDSARIAKGALKKIHPGSIIIFHDGFDGRGGNRAQTIEAVKLTVNELLSKGYRFVPLTSKNIS
jgi:peptidoglycan-N-acetylglucosamine deacetylase